MFVILFVCLFVVIKPDHPFFYILILQAALNPPFIVCGGLFVYRSLMTDSMFLVCRGLFVIFRVQAAVENCRNCQHCCAFTVVKYVKEMCETAHIIPN